MTAETAIELVPTDALIQELFRRHDHGILLLRAVQKSRAHHKQKWKGDPHVCLGLAADISLRVLGVIREEERPDDGQWD